MIARLFVFNQNHNEQTSAVICLSYILQKNYTEYVKELSDLKPEMNGLYLTDIYRQLKNHHKRFVFSFPSDNDVIGNNHSIYMIRLYNNQKPHYVLYHNGHLYDPLKNNSEPKNMNDLRDLVEKSIPTCGGLNDFDDKYNWCIRIIE